MSALSYHNHTRFDNTPTTDARTARALALLDAGSVQPDGPGVYFVHSQTGDATYTVKPAEHTCDCPDRRLRHVWCKHLEAVRLLRWEHRVCQLCEQAGISLAELKHRIERNVVLNGIGTAPQKEAVEAICRIWDRQREVQR